MHEGTALQRSLKAAAGVCMLAAMIFLLTGCKAGSYQISVSGHQAKGHVSFTQIPGGQE